MSHEERKLVPKVNKNGFTSVHLKYNVEDEDTQKQFNNALVGVVENPGALISFKTTLT